MRTGKPAGFTLVELLVVIGIIGILASITLPAVQAAREAARMNGCRSNVSQLAKAMLQHEAMQQSFPSGGWGPPWLGVAERGNDARQPGGWVFGVLPYIEEKMLRDQLVGVTAGTASAAYAKLVAAPVPIFACPSRRSHRVMSVPAGLRDARGAGDVSLTLATATRSDYAMNSGAAGPCASMASFKGSFKSFQSGSKNANQNAAKKVTLCHNGRTQTIALQAVDSAGHENDTLGPCESCSKPFDSTNMRVFDSLSSGSKPGDAWIKLTQAEKVALDQQDMGIPDIQDGMVSRMSRLRAAHAVDGLSNTYLLGEKYVRMGSYDTGDDDGDSRSMMVGYSHDTVRWGFDPPRPDVRRESWPTIFGSGHRGGWNAAFADGMVRTIGFEIDPTLHKQLSNRDGINCGEMAGMPPQ